MSVVVRPAAAEDIDGVCDLLHTHMSARISRERWRRLLDYPWRPADADRGRVAVADGGRIVGFLGLVYADRTIAGRQVRFCNICAWYLLKELRGTGIGRALQEGSIADRSATYTLVTATAGTDRAFRAAGFGVLDSERYILPRRGGAHREVELLEGADAIAHLLEPGERTVLSDHRDANLRHVLAVAGGRSCYIVLQNKLLGDDVAYHQVLHAGDLDFLSAHAEALAEHLLPEGKAVLAIDRRFILSDRPWPHETLRQPRLFSSPDLRPPEVDNLYNEIVLLDLKLP